METFERILSEHPFFKGMPDNILKLIQSCATNVHFKAGEFVYREGGDADKFYLIRDGKIAVETFIIGRGAITIETLNTGDVLGWSWLLPPYKWHFDARVLLDVHAIAINGKCIREKSEADHDLGYEVMKRFAGIIVRRLQATRIQFLDVYGQH